MNIASQSRRHAPTIISVMVSVLAFAAVSLFFVTRAEEKSRPPVAEPVLSQEAKAVEDGLGGLEARLNHLISRAQADSDNSLSQIWRRLAYFKNWTESLRLDPDTAVRLRNHAKIIEARINQYELRKRQSVPAAGTIDRGFTKAAILAPKATGAISGTVTDSSTSLPIANINVEIYNAAGAFVTNTMTDGSGNYTSPSLLSTGNYFVRTTNSLGYINELYNNITCLFCNVTTGTAVAVTDGATTSGINFALAPGGRISGTVTNAATSAPLVSVNVQIFDSGGAFVANGFTDGSGNYTSDVGLVAGSYFVRTNNGQGFIDKLYNNITCVTCNVTSGTAITVSAGATTSGINFALNAGGRIAGTITDAATAAPISNVVVGIFNSTGAFVTNGFTDGTGNYITGSGLLPGNYFASTNNSAGYVNKLYNNITCVTCNVTSGTPISVSAGATTSGINFSLNLGGRIAGTVTDSTTSAPLANVNVQIFNSSGAFVTSGFTDGSGNYLSDSGLLPGNHYVRTINSLGYIDEVYNNNTCLACDPTSGNAVFVTAGATTSGINFALAAGGRIAGTVTASATSAPITNLHVQIFNSSGRVVSDAFTDGSGNYISLNGLTAGTYYARTSNSAGYIDEVYNNITCLICNPTSGTPITVTTGATTSGINFALGAGGRISGTVTDGATAAPLANINVDIFDATGQFVTSGFTEGSGNYVTAGGLPSGTYYARTNNSAGYVNKLYNNITCVVCNVTSGTAISVTAGATTSGISFSLNTGGRISGTVTDAATAAPIANVNVQIANSSGAIVTSGFTDTAGQYLSAAGLTSGNYYVLTQNSQGYINEVYNNIACLNCNPTSGTPVSVTAGATTSGISFSLNTGGRIAGTITDSATSAPLAGVSVQIVNSSGMGVASGFTDGSGSYVSAEGLPSGTYFARTFNSLGYVDEIYNNITCLTCNTTSGTPITVTTGATTSGINFALGAGGRISGTVTDAATTAGIANVNVAIFDAVGFQVANDFTDSTGSYTTDIGLPPGTYYARTFNSAGYVNKLYNNITCLNCNVTTGTQITVTAGATTSGINFALSAGGRIAGTLTDAATTLPIANAQVEIFDANNLFLGNYNTDGSGNYLTGDGLPTGTYFARTSNQFGYINKLYNNIVCTQCNPTTGTPINVTAGATVSGINFALTLGGRISGTVTDAATTLPIANVQVEIFDPTGLFVTSGFTDNAGNYTTGGGVSTGNYFARTRNSSGYIEKLYNNITCLNCNPATGTPISVTVGSTTTGINFALTTGGRISGTVTDAATSAPIPSTNVEIFNSSGVLVGTAFTDFSGGYLSSGLTAGTYYARTNSGSGYLNKLYNNIDCSSGCNPTTGTAITVSVGATTSGINFALNAGGRISGTVTDAATSLPLANVTVQIYAANGAFLSQFNTDGSGNYTTGSGLPTGTYFARTTNALGYMDELYNNITCVFCDVTTGTPISVTAGSTTTGINFALALGGRISGTVTDSATSAAIANVSVEIFNSSGTFISTGFTNNAGNYTTSGGLPAGNYFARTRNQSGYIEKLYNNITCFNCPVTTGTPITVTVGATTTGINFALAIGGRISGTVTDAATSAPLANVNINIFDSSGLNVANGFTNGAGQYTTGNGVPTGNYFAVTSNSQGYIEKLYNNITCVSCDVTTGTPIAVTAGATTAGINFALTAGGRISGTITNAATSAPLANVNVQIFNSSGVTVANAFTDGSGNYITNSGLLAGNYFARTNNSQGFVDELFDNITCINCNPTTGTPITVTAGATTTGKNFALAAGGRIAGTVTDAATSAPLANVNVQIFNSSGTFLFSTGTDSAGNYLTGAGLPAGNYFARTSNTQGYIEKLYNNITCVACAVTTGTPIAMTGGMTTSGINFALNAGGRISGTVTDSSTTAPIANVNIQVFNSTGAFLTSVNTNGSGNYTTVVGLTTGNYFVRTTNSLGYVNELYNNITCVTCNVTTGTPVAVTAGSTTTGINFALAPGGSVAGTVTDSSTTAPIANVTVQIFNSNGPSIASANTNASGNYSVTGLPAGTYFARTTNSLGYINELYNNINCALNCTVTTGTPITVTAGATTSGINFALDAGGRIAGTVTDSSTTAPIANINVQLVDSNGFNLISVNTDASGNYIFNSGLPAGTYFARTNNALGYINEVYNNITCVPCNVTSGTPIMVALGKTTSGINFALAPGGRISGTVTDAVTSLPIANVQIQIRNTGGSVVANAATNASGNYTLGPGLPAGTYFARTNNVPGYINEIYNNIECMTCNQTSGTPIAVTIGATTSGINFTLAPGGRIAGTVTDAATSEPLPGISVEIYNSVGVFVFNTITDLDGNYLTIPGLISGNYFVRTSSETGYINELYNGISCPACNVITGTPVTVAAGATTSGINLALDQGGLIAGTVTDSTTSAPVANVEVDIYDSCGNIVTAGFTDASGNYVILDGLPTGSYFAVTANNPGYVSKIYNNVTCNLCDVMTGTPISVTAGATTTGINFALAPGGTIAGTVTYAATGAGLQGVSINIFDSSGVFVAFGNSNIEGKFITFAALPTGTYYARTSNNNGYINQVYNNITCLGCDPLSGTPITVTAGATTSGINFAMTLGGRIYGAISNASTSAPLLNISLQVYNTAGTFVTTMATDSSGNYISRGGLTTGNYFVRTVNNQGFIDKVYNNIECVGCVATTGTPVAVTLGSTTSGINFALNTGGRISGAVTNAATSNPLVSTPVQIYNSAGGLVTTAFTDCSGNYTSPAGLPTGTYYARTANTRGFVDILYNNITCISCDPLTGTGIAVTNGQTTTAINFALCGFSLSQSGKLFGASGGEGSFAVTSPGACNWAATSNAAWIEITSSPVGLGNGTVTYLVRDNLGGAPRTGTISVANQTFTITQEGQSASGCTYAISPQFATFNSLGGTGSINVTTAAGCAWKAESNKSWLVVTSACCGIGNGSVFYSVEPNTTGSGRSGVITINGEKFNVKQKGN